MSGDIGPGDVVVCVDASPRPYTAPGTKLLVQRGVYRVVGIIAGPRGANLDVKGPFAGRTPGPIRSNFNLGYVPDRFRKLNDGEDDAELIARIKGRSPVRQPVTAGKLPCPAEGGDLSPVVALNPSDDRSL